MKNISSIQCLHCNTPIGEVADLVQLSDEGVGAHYVNSHGIVHDMLTIEKAHVAVVGDPEPDHSWFPGYAWQIAYCEGCRMHLGWVFTAIDPHRGLHRVREEEEKAMEEGNVSRQIDRVFDSLLKGSVMEILGLFHGFVVRSNYG